MRWHRSRQRVLIKSGKRTAEGSYFAVAERLSRKPFDGIVSVAAFAPGFVTERVPGPFGRKSPACILNRHDEAVFGEVLRRPDVDHHRRMLPVRTALE